MQPFLEQMLNERGPQTVSRPPLQINSPTWLPKEALQLRDQALSLLNGGDRGSDDNPPKDPDGKTIVYEPGAIGPGRPPC